MSTQTPRSLVDLSARKGLASCLLLLPNRGRRSNYRLNANNGVVNEPWLQLKGNDAVIDYRMILSCNKLGNGRNPFEYN